MAWSLRPPFDRWAGAALSLSRPARALLTLRPTGSPSRSTASLVIPDQAARQLPDQSTTFPVEPSSDGSRLRAHSQQATFCLSIDCIVV